MKLLALDGNSIINRAFYGIKLLSTKDGIFTNGIYGFINILNSLIEREKPDGVAVAFDLKAPTFRHKMYEGYKAGRKPMPEELRPQIPLLKELLTLMGHHCLELEGYEADDILGTLSLVAENNEDVCVISTGDRDSLQLVSEHTTVLLATTKMGRAEIVEYTPETLMEKYTLTPPQMIELKALMGDASDKIPGVAGVGEKTATDLINRFGSIQYIYDNIEDLDIKPGVKTKLVQDKDNAFLSKDLGTICRNVPIETDFSKYVFAQPKGEELAKLLKRLEFFKLMEKMGLSSSVEVEETQTAAEFNVVDFKTLEENIAPGKTLTLLLKENNLYINLENYVSLLNVNDDALSIKRIFEKEGVILNTVDSKEIYTAMDRLLGDRLADFDITLAGYLCSPSSGSYDVLKLADRYLNSKPKLENEDENLKKVALAGMLYEPLKGEISSSGLEFVMEKIELPLARLLSEMERDGVLIDTKGIAEMRDSLNLRIADLEKEIYLLSGEDFNIKSPAQLGVILFEKLGLKAGKKTKSGYSTTADILEKLVDDHPIIPLILDYRRLTKLNATYCEGLLKAVDSDGRVRSTFNQTETRTGRISSLEPNLQNIPVRSEEGRELRRFFKAKEGYLLLDSDYSQIELRVLAHISKDKTMINAFKCGEDIHTKTAGEVFNMPPLLVTPKMRSSAKAVNFGIVYGIGAFSLAKDIGVTRKEAAEYIEGYFKTYPGVATYMERVVSKAREDGFAATMFGRRRYLPELSSSNGNLRAFGERVARNMPIQGTAADIIKLAMIKTRDSLKKSGLDAKVILQVHDELIVEAEESIAKEAAKILETEMERAVELAVPLIVDVHRAKTWYDAKG